MENDIYLEKVEYLNTTLESVKDEMSARDQRKLKRIRSGEIKDRKACFEQSLTMLMKLDLRKKYLIHATGIKSDTVDLMGNFLNKMGEKDKEFKNRNTDRYYEFQREVFSRLDEQNKNLKALKKDKIKDDGSQEKFNNLVTKTINKNIDIADRDIAIFCAKLDIFSHLFESNYMPGGSKAHIEKELEKGENSNLD